MILKVMSFKVEIVVEKRRHERPPGAQAVTPSKG